MITYRISCGRVRRDICVDFAFVGVFEFCRRVSACLRFDDIAKSFFRGRIARMLDPL